MAIKAGLQILGLAAALIIAGCTIHYQPYCQPIEKCERIK